MIPFWSGPCQLHETSQAESEKNGFASNVEDWKMVGVLLDTFNANQREVSKTDTPKCTAFYLRLTVGFANRASPILALPYKHSTQTSRYKFPIDTNT